MSNTFIPGYGSSAYSSDRPTTTRSIAKEDGCSSVVLRVFNGGDVDQYSEEPYSSSCRFPAYREMIEEPDSGARCLPFRFELDGFDPCESYMMPCERIHNISSDSIGPSLSE